MLYFLKFFFFIIVYSTTTLKTYAATGARNSADCILANDTGNYHALTIPSNPNLASDNLYSHGNNSQKATWTDSKLYTDGSDGFDFVIEGSWTPWYGDNSGITKDVEGNVVSIKSDPNNFCFVETLREPYDPGSTEIIGKKGEFDYPKSAYTVIDYGDSYLEQYLLPYKQKPCYFNAGIGLYIAFFGKNGNTLPSIATHMKVAKVVCDSPYNMDKNGDGIFTINECYDIDDSTKTNMAYYKPTIGGPIHAYVECESDYYHGSGDPKSENLKIGINDCWSEEKLASGAYEKVDRTRFRFHADYLYNSPTKEKVQKNQRIKFIIADRYYSDNSGSYYLKIYKGATDMKDSGLIAKILNDMERAFVGDRADGDYTSGLLYRFYGYIVKDSSFIWIVRMALVLYMAFTGMQLAMGTFKFETKEFYLLLMKITLIISFTTKTSWTLYNHIVVSFFLDGFSSIILFFANVANNMFDATADLTISTKSTFSDKFAFMDHLVTFAFSKENSLKLLGLVFGHWYGFIVIIPFYFLIIKFVLALLDSIFPYIISFIQAIVALALGPIFIMFALFKTTKHMFDSWLGFLAGRFINMAFLFLYIFAFGSIIKKKFEALLMFDVCKIPFLNIIYDIYTKVTRRGIIIGVASKYTGMEKIWRKVLNFLSFGGKMWVYQESDTYQLPTFFNFLADLLYIYIFIRLFSYLSEKIPGLVDGLVSIGGSDGGKSSDFLGSKNSSFSSALNDSIKVESVSKNDKGELEVKSAGLTDFVGGTISRNTVGRLTNGVSSKLKDIGRRISAAITQKSDDFLIGKAAQYANEYGLTGKEAYDKAANEYRELLASLGNSAEEIEKRMEGFKLGAQGYFYDKPFNEAMERTMQRISQAGPNLSDEEKKDMLKNSMNDFVKKNFGDDERGKQLLDGMDTNPRFKSLFFDFKNQRGLNGHEMLTTSRFPDLRHLREEQFARNLKFSTYGYGSSFSDAKSILNDGKQKDNKHKLQSFEFNADSRLSNFRKDYFDSLSNGFKDIANAHLKSLNSAIDAINGYDNDKTKLGDALDRAEATEKMIWDLMREAHDVEIIAKTEGNNLILEGINGETFGLQGISDIGMPGVSNEFNLRGASSVVMGSEFISDNKEEEENKHQEQMKKMEELREKMEKQKLKILQFKESKEDDEKFKLTEEEKNELAELKKKVGRNKK